MNVNIRSSDWTHDDTQANATATATRAAPEKGLSHYVTHVAGSYDATRSGKTLILKEGSTELLRWHVYDALTIEFASPIKIAAGTAANLELEASGAGATSGTASMAGYTV